MACAVDLTRKADVDRMVGEIIERFGQIDILVNCQGWDRLEPFVESDEADLGEDSSAINFKCGAVHGTRGVADHDLAITRQGHQHRLRRRPGGIELAKRSTPAPRARSSHFRKTLAREMARYHITSTWSARA